ncbi:restriction endonuclease [Acinetobacter baumannii]|nr:restriction endonuclease [Acinetobacter baumannii]
MTKNTGKDYEIFTGKLYAAILASEAMGIGPQKNIQVEVNKILIDNNGSKRQFDVYWEYEIGGILYRTVIECKDYKNTVSVNIVDSLIGKLRDFHNIKGLIATKKGFQDGAHTKAQANGIELLIVREQNDSDWEDKNGNPFIKEVHLNFHIQMPARITNLKILIPEENATKASTRYTGRNDEIFITNFEENKKYSLKELAEILRDKHPNESGKFEELYTFKGQIDYPDGSFKIDGYEVEYQISKTIEDKKIIDFSLAVEGVVEYLNQGKKAKVYKDGNVHLLK